MFGMVAGDVLYFRVDEGSRAAFAEAAGKCWWRGGGWRWGAVGGGGVLWGVGKGVGGPGDPPDKPGEGHDGKGCGGGGNGLNG